MTTAAVGTLAAAVSWLFVTFETSAGSEQKWQQHNQAITCRTVYELQAEIRGYLKKLELASNLSPQDIAWIEAEIEALQENIKRLDPDGIC